MGKIDWRLWRGVGVLTSLEKGRKRYSLDRFASQSSSANDIQVNGVGAAAHNQSGKYQEAIAERVSRERGWGA
jgi:hypothetical protein